jgi:hypothetical protein
MDLAEKSNRFYRSGSLFQHPRPPLEGEDRGEGGAFALTLALSRKRRKRERVQNVLWSKKPCSK